MPRLYRKPKRSQISQRQGQQPTRWRYSTPKAKFGRWNCLEAELIRYAITHYRGQMSEVARRLQIGRSTLYRKLETLGVK